MSDPSAVIKKGDAQATKRLAPIPAALAPDVMRWSENATIAGVGVSLNKLTASDANEKTSVKQTKQQASFSNKL